MDVAVGCASGTVKYLCLGLNLHYICPALFNLKCQTLIICSAPQRHITGEAKLYLLQFLMWLTGVLWQDSVYLVKGFRLNFLNWLFAIVLLELSRSARFWPLLEGEALNLLS